MSRLVSLSRSVKVPQELPDFLKVLKNLDSEGVRYVVVGGIALVLHGGNNVTSDLDFAISREPENILAGVRALKPFHPYPSHLSSGKGFVWDERSFDGLVTSLTTDVGDVDILLAQPGVTSFEELYERSLERDLRGLTIRVASIEDLISMKEAAGRPRDKEHLRLLKALQRLTNEEGQN